MYRLAENFLVSAQNENFAEKTADCSGPNYYCRCGPRACATHPHTCARIIYADLAKPLADGSETERFLPRKFSAIRYTQPNNEWLSSISV